jgi:hypothetical protein
LKAEFINPYFEVEVKDIIEIKAVLKRRLAIPVPPGGLLCSFVRLTASQAM